MKAVWKFKIELDDTVKVMMPENAQILDVQNQVGEICIWALVDLDNNEEERRFHIHGTGRIIKDSSNLKYIKTFQIRDGHFVFHLFENIKKSPIKDM